MKFKLLACTSIFRTIRLFSTYNAEKIPLPLYFEEITFQSRNKTDFLNQTIILNLITEIQNYEPDFYIRTLVNHFRSTCNKPQYKTILTNSSHSDDYMKDVNGMLDKMKKKKANYIALNLIAKSRYKMVSKYKKHLKKFTITNKDNEDNFIHKFDEFFVTMGTHLENLLLKSSLDFRKSTIFLGKSMAETAYMMSEGGKLDKMHFENESVLNTIGYLCLTEISIIYLENRISGTHFSIEECPYLFETMKNLHSAKKTNCSIMLKNVPSHIMNAIYSLDSSVSIALKKRSEYERIMMYYVIIQQFYSEYYEAVEVIFKIMYATKVLKVCYDEEIYQKKYLKRAKIFNKGFLFRFRSYDEFLEEVKYYSQFSDGKSLLFYFV